MRILVQFACFVVIYANLDHYGVTARKPKMTPPVKELLIQEGGELKLSCQGEGRPRISAHSYSQLKVPQSNFTGSFDEDSNTYTFIRPKTIRGDTGWYACAEENVLIDNDELTIDHPEEEISWIYVYVNPSTPFVTDTFARYVIHGWTGNPTVIPCRTTSPNLPVRLEFRAPELWRNEDLEIPIDGTQTNYENWQVVDAPYIPKIGFITDYFHDKEGSIQYRCVTADNAAVFYGPEYFLHFIKYSLQDPFIEVNTIGRVNWGEDLTLNCTVDVPTGTKILMNWTVPNSVPRRRSHRPMIFQHLLHVASRDGFDTWNSALIINNVSKTDGGEYICVVQDGYGKRTESSVKIEVWDPSYTFINVSVKGETEITVYEGGLASWYMTIDAYPDIVELYWCNPDGIRLNVTEEFQIPKELNELKYSFYFLYKALHFRIYNPVIEDSGNYTLHVSTAHNKTSLILTLTVLRKRPRVTIGLSRTYFAPRESVNVSCWIDSWDLSNITWSHKEYLRFPSKEIIVYRSPLASTDRYYNSISPWFRPGFKFNLQSDWIITIEMPGDLVCTGCDANGCTEATEQILVSDLAQRFGVVGPDTVTEGDDVDVTCGASVYDFYKITWELSENPIAGFFLDHIDVTNNQTNFTFLSVLQIQDVGLFDHGIYKCEATNRHDKIETEYYTLIVKEASPPYFTGPTKNISKMVIDLTANNTKTVLLECLAGGRPTPKVTWWKNDEILISSSQYKLSRDNFSLEIEIVSESDGGRYTCHATSRVGEVQKYTDIKIAAHNSTHTNNDNGVGTHVVIWSNVIVAVVLLLVMVVWMSIRKRREMAARRRFMEATLQRFNAGALDCLDPELNMAEQAELLPYNKKWEFPRELLKFGKELGSGAFGVVRMAQAKSICKSEAVTTVAVKVVRSTANLDHMTALQRELKVLVYLGKHLNVVNLLGACTKRVTFGQLLVIVEFCRFGNLRDYLVWRRVDFVSETANVTEDIDTDSSDGEDLHTTCNDNGVDGVDCNVNSASAVFNRGTDSKDRSTAVVNRVPEPDPPKQVRRTNYLGDYNEDDNLEPISTRDLLCWAWQVARGMKFLGLRRILHGDLAARNILLADHNVVKICDFGLAKTLFTDDNYQKKGNDPLPYKWMAIESLKDRIFSVHSDVWSYGVVLWEFYSLSKTPYSGMRPETLYEKLAEGSRMARPQHATPEIYQMMLNCWNAEPFQRPSFAKLVEDIGQLMEDNVKTQYFDLNASYVRMTVDASEPEVPDFLTMSTSEVLLNTNGQTPA